MVSVGALAAGLGHDMSNVLLPVRAQINVLQAAGSRLLNQTGERACRGASPAGSADSEDIRPAVNAIAASVGYLQQLADGLHYLTQNPETAQPEGPATDVGDWWALAGVVVSKAVPRHVKLSASIADGLPPGRQADGLLAAD